MSTNTPLTKHRWVSAYHWFEEFILDGNNIHGGVRADISNLVRNVDPEIIEQYYGSQMSEEGYYDEILEDNCPECNKTILLDEAIQCWECEEWFHNDMSCIDINEEYKDPICYSCLEVKESVHQ